MLKIRERSKRRGAVLVWTTLGLIVFLGFTALAVDLGYLYSVHADVQATADASALAGAEGLTIGVAEARARAFEYASKNTANGAPVILADSDIEVGLWNSVSRTFTPLPDDSLVQPDSVRVTPRLTEATGNPVGLFFGRVLGINDADVSASATAFYRARDIVLVLDLSASMNDDSEFQHIPDLGQTAIETNLYQIWTQLGAPTFGNMAFDPVTISSSDETVIMNTLGLDAVPYPYPGGSWSDYFDYVQDDNDVANAGYENGYGYLTLVNYWLERQPMSTQTPDLWQVSAQPITAVKDAVGLFLAYLQQVSTSDQVGLSVYTYTDETALLEAGLTDDFGLIETITRERQAGHYHLFTNIGAGIEKARDELVDNARPGTFKMIVLITDGIANRPGGPASGRQYALDQAQLTADENIQILTISLGAAADTDLMDDIADITGGVHFNVPGGQSVNSYEDDLNDIFTDIAGHRPLQLVE